MKLKKVVVNGQSYLGKLVETDDVTALVDAMVCSDPGSKDSLQQYVQAKNLKTLVTVEFGGVGTNYSISELCEHEKLLFKQCKMSMKYAKSIALAKLENKDVGSLMGKY